MRRGSGLGRLTVAALALATGSAQGAPPSAELAWLLKTYPEAERLMTRPEYQS